MISLQCPRKRMRQATETTGLFCGLGSICCSDPTGLFLLKNRFFLVLSILVLELFSPICSSGPSPPGSLAGPFLCVSLSAGQNLVGLDSWFYSSCLLPWSIYNITELQQSQRNICRSAGARGVRTKEGGLNFSCWWRGRHDLVGEE